MAGAEFRDSGYFSTPWPGFYLQDELRLGRRSRLSVGARLEWEGGSTERYNRAQGGGFDFNARLPFSEAVEAAYARNPLPDVAPSQFKARGGAFYLGQNAPRTLTNSQLALLPRVGLVFQVKPTTVVRLGLGWYADTLTVNDFAMNQLGYSVDTTTTVSNDNGLTLCCDLNNRPFEIARLSSTLTPLSNPFPIRADGTRWEKPYGNSLGPSMFAGRAVSFYDRDYNVGRMTRWRIGVQRELSRNLVAEVSYNSSWAVRPLGTEGTSQPVNYIPAAYYSTAKVRNTTMDADMNSKVPNPFHFGNFAFLAETDPRLYNYLRTQSFFTSTTIAKSQLRRLYPLFGEINGKRPGDTTKGYPKYHDLQMQLEQRMRGELATAVMYTHANSDDKYTYLNAFDPTPVWEDNGDARPHVFVWTGTYELPFGSGKRFVRNGFLRPFVSGWQISWVYKYQTGISIIFSGSTRAPLFYYGDVTQIAKRLNHKQAHKQDIHVWFDPTAVYQAKVTTPIPPDFVGFEGRAAFQPAYNVNTFPVRFKDVRADGLRFWNANIKREFLLNERARVRLGVDLLNLTNHTNFGSPNITVTSSLFGRVTSQNGDGRMIQAHLRLDF